MLVAGRMVSTKLGFSIRLVTWMSLAVMPCSSSASTRCEPANPVPPVMRIVGILCSSEPTVMITCLAQGGGHKLIACVDKPLLFTGFGTGKIKAGNLRPFNERNNDIGIFNCRFNAFLLTMMRFEFFQL